MGQNPQHFRSFRFQHMRIARFPAACICTLPSANSVITPRFASLEPHTMWRCRVVKSHDFSKRDEVFQIVWAYLRHWTTVILSIAWTSRDWKALLAWLESVGFGEVERTIHICESCKHGVYIIIFYGTINFENLRISLNFRMHWRYLCWSDKRKQAELDMFLRFLRFGGPGLDANSSGSWFVGFLYHGTSVWYVLLWKILMASGKGRVDLW
jgi:hypothetical protein